MDTVLRSRSSSVTIGAHQPFCVIGERINPTGRKRFAQELRDGDLSTVAVDAEAQVQAGANMLDVHAGIPLVDQPELLRGMLRTVHETVDVPICIDSSVIEALEAGAVGVRGEGAGQLGDRRGRAPGGDPAPGGAPRRSRDRAGQRRDGDPRDAPEAAEVRAQDRQRRQRLRHRHRGRPDRSAGHDRRRRHRGRHHHPWPRSR